MKKIRKHEGITLVALIITIVVLLILAVVAIGVVQDSKIIGHAQNAAGGYNETKKVEENTLSNYIQIIDLYLPQEEPQDVIASIKIGDLDELVYTHENGEKIGYNDTSIYLDRDKFKEKVGEEAYKTIESYNASIALFSCRGVTEDGFLYQKYKKKQKKR